MKCLRQDTHQVAPKLRTSVGLDWAIFVLVCLLVFAVHGSALHGYWRGDDGAHLYSAARYPVTSFFLDPEVMRFISGNQITPWNVFTYWVNLSLFGFAPKGYYVHHLLSLAAAAGALFLLLRQWLDRKYAVIPVLLLVLGVPTMQMAQLLMVGHYLDGLTFACLAIWAHVRAVRSGRWIWAAASAILYLFACLCKEIYVPWVALLVLVAPVPLRQSWRYATPVILVALAYTAFRILLFSGMGGTFVSAQPLRQSWLDFGRILPSLLGADLLGISASFMCGLALVLGVIAQPRSQRILVAARFLVSLVAIVLPLLFVVAPGIAWNEHARYLWMPWIGLSVLWCLPWPQRLTHWRYLALLLVALATWQQSVHQRHMDAQVEALFEAHYRFVLEPEVNVSLLPVVINTPGYLNWVTFSARAARHLVEPTVPLVPITVVHDVPSTPAQIASIRVWQESCRCMARFDSLAAQQQQAALQVQTRNLALAWPVGGVLPLIAGAFGGAIDLVQVQGKRLHVTGWTPTIGPGRMLVFLGFTDAATAHIESVPRPDIVNLFSRTDMTLAGFHATLEFADETLAWQASQKFCAIVQGQLPEQEHMFLVLPLQNSQRCDRMLVPKSVQ